MIDKTELCTTYLGLFMRPSEREALRREAERVGMSTAGLIRSKIPEIFEPAAPGRRWSSDPVERRRKTR